MGIFLESGIYLPEHHHQYYDDNGKPWPPTRFDDGTTDQLGWSNCGPSIGASMVDFHTNGVRTTTPPLFRAATKRTRARFGGGTNTADIALGFANMGIPRQFYSGVSIEVYRKALDTPGLMVFTQYAYGELPRVKQCQKGATFDHAIGVMGGHTRIGKEGQTQHLVYDGLCRERPGDEREGTMPGTKWVSRKDVLDGVMERQGAGKTSIYFITVRRRGGDAPPDGELPPIDPGEPLPPPHVPPDTDPWQEPWYDERTGHYNAPIMQSVATAGIGGAAIGGVAILAIVIMGVVVYKMGPKGILAKIGNKA